MSLPQTVQLRRAARIILVGAPGVGKGTQTERMLKRFPQLSSISSGDLLRENVRNRTPLGIQAESLMSTGALVPDSMILRLIHNALTTRGWLIPKDGAQRLTLNSMAVSAAAPATNDTALPSANVGSLRDTLVENDNFITLPPREDDEYNFSDDPDASYILDGFPRNVTQARQLDKLIPVNLVVDIQTPADIIMDRICNRWVHPASGRVYNTGFNAPKVAGVDDITGEKLMQRDDDKPEVWKARLKGFEELSRPLLQHYERKGVLWRVQGNSSDDITPLLFEEFGKRFGMI
ncbi:P-loop containing nucleoside triphosphate hydrolase protein [Polychaeton citri CBS 116435]|uniref:GTP:AMP phosphotransferase, mitochondrial n=1 Tax=Polychaeton citri CBS 116435 TaxID=1314669 RepID=A0A9P4PYR9_9PEZI|nr:P-loop containing nucleoside triphosphate hydrolase protein [Polychaeton citri CBS 116435]